MRAAYGAVLCGQALFVAELFQRFDKTCDQRYGRQLYSPIRYTTGEERTREGYRYCAGGIWTRLRVFAAFQQNVQKADGNDAYGVLQKSSKILNARGKVEPGLPGSSAAPTKRHRAEMFPPDVEDKRLEQLSYRIIIIGRRAGLPPASGMRPCPVAVALAADALYVNSIYSISVVMPPVLASLSYPNAYAT